MAALTGGAWTAARTRWAVRWRALAVLGDGSERVEGVEEVEGGGGGVTGGTGGSEEVGEGV